MAASEARPVTFVTGNAGKLREAGEILGRPIRGVELDLEELQIVQLEPLVRHKAAQAYRLLGIPLMVEDTALVFAAWDTLPGPLIKHFLASLAVEGLAKALAPFGDCSAEALSGIGYHDGWRVHYFEGRISGEIVPPRGEGGFGWDSIFQAEGEQRTFAEMTAAEKHTLSMRARALAKLAAFLAES